MSSPADKSPIPVPSSGGARRVGRSKKFLLWMVGLIVVGLGIAALAKPSYRQMKAVRARRAAALGESHLAAGRLEEAARQARLALELAPAEPTSLRLAGRISAMGMRPEALAYWQSYMVTGNALPSERLEVAELAVRLGRTDVARSLLEALVRESPQDRHVWRLLQRHVRNLGDIRQAVSLARMVVAKFPGDTEAEVELADLLVLSGDPKSREEGRRILWGVAMVPSAIQPSAASILLGQSLLSPVDAETLSRILGTPGGTNAPGVHLLRGRLQLLAHPERRQEVITKVTSTVPTNAPVAEVCELVLWLTDVGALEYAGPFLPSDRCRTNLLLMAGQLDYLVSTGRDEQLRRVLDDPGSVLDPGMRSAAEGALAARRGRREEAERAFRGALDSGATRIHLIAPFVAREAERHGFTEVAVQALQIGMDAPGRALANGRQILRLLERNPDSTQALLTLRKLNAALPGEDAVVAERLWLELLAGENAAWALPEATRLAAAKPDDASLRAALALARWRNGDTSRSLPTIEEGLTDAESMPVRFRVAYTAILGANDQREAARRIARTLPQGSLRQHAEKLVAPWR
jgi:tetratricopeptide (TPR) repeat protein